MTVIIKSALVPIAVGILLGVGFRLAEYLVPPPEVRVVVCTYSDSGKVELCKSAFELLNKPQQ